MAFDSKGFSLRLSALRELRGLTQEQLAERAGLSAHYVGNLEQNVRRPSMNALLALCSALGATPDYFFQDSLSDDMRNGRCAPAPDGNSLRDACAELARALVDWLEPDDYLFSCPSEEDCELVDEAGDRFISVCELLDEASDAKE